MTRRPVDRTAANLSERLRRAAGIIPTIRTHLQEQRAHIITVGAATTDTGRNTTGHSDPTARIALELAHLDYREGLIDDALASITVGINLLDRECSNALGHHATITPDTSRDPVCHWGGCSDPVGSYLLKDGTVRWRMGGEYGGLCDRHRIAAMRAAS